MKECYWRRKTYLIQRHNIFNTHFVRSLMLVRFLSIVNFQKWFVTCNIRSPCSNCRGRGSLKSDKNKGFIYRFIAQYYYIFIYSCKQF